MKRYLHAMFDAVPTSFRGYMMAGTRAGGAGGAKPRALKRAGCPFSFSEETSLSVDPGRPMELFVENISHASHLAIMRQSYRLLAAALKLSKIYDSSCFQFLWCSQGV